MNHVVLSFLAAEAIGFCAAALVHAGVLAHGFEHSKAATAESVIALVLGIGLVASAVVPRWSRTVGLAVQAFALLGTAVGIFAIIVGVGPQSTFDVALHTGFVTLLIIGLIAVARGSSRVQLPRD